MVSQGRVQTLIVSDGYRAPGFVEQEAGTLSVYETVSTPFDHPMKPVEDVVEAAVNQAMDMGGKVELISDNQELDRAGRIGAILRY